MHSAGRDRESWRPIHGPVARRHETSRFGRLRAPVSLWRRRSDWRVAGGELRSSAFFCRSATLTSISRHPCSACLRSRASAGGARPWLKRPLPREAGRVTVPACAVPSARRRRHTAPAAGSRSEVSFQARTTRLSSRSSARSAPHASSGRVSLHESLDPPRAVRSARGLREEDAGEDDRAARELCRAELLAEPRVRDERRRDRLEHGDDAHPRR